MSGFYEDMEATAAGLIAEFGAPVILVRPKGEPDPVEGEIAGGGELSLATTGIFLSRTVATVRESLAEGADRMCVIDSSVEPQMKDSVKSGADVFAVVRIDTIKPAALALAYILHCKR